MQLAVGDDQHSKIWRGSGAQFGGYCIGWSEHLSRTLAQPESRSPSIAVG